MSDSDKTFEAWWKKEARSDRFGSWKALTRAAFEGAREQLTQKRLALLKEIAESHSQRDAALALLRRAVESVGGAGTHHHPACIWWAEQPQPWTKERPGSGRVCNCWLGDAWKLLEGQ